MTIFTILGRLPGANEAVNADRSHWAKGRKLKALATKQCALAAIVGGVPKFKTPVTISFRWFEPNKKRDLDNISHGQKFVIDGLRMCGKLENDGWSWVLGLSHSFAVDPVNPRVEVTITPYQ